MDEAQARQLGGFLRRRRIERKLGLRALARLSGLNSQTILRIERGDFLTPGPDKLKALARALRIPLSDLWNLAGYHVDEEMPNTLPFLRAKYRDLPDETLDALTQDVASVLRQHGIDPNGRPAIGEDEDINDESKDRHY
jgi:transcriptional regulator with XRE-family HTH domain